MHVQLAPTYLTIFAFELVGGTRALAIYMALGLLHLWAFSAVILFGSKRALKFGEILSAAFFWPSAIPAWFRAFRRMK